MTSSYHVSMATTLQGVLRRVGRRDLAQRSLLHVTAGLLAGQGMGAFLSFDAHTLLEFGGRWTPALLAGEWWRLGTCVFLHAGLWHIGFNVFALLQIGPAIEEQFGKARMVFLFMLTGIFAALGSAFIGPWGVGIGASGAIMGLIGAAVGWGHREGTTQGRLLRNRMLKWTAYVFIFGCLYAAEAWNPRLGFQ